MCCGPVRMCAKQPRAWTQKCQKAPTNTVCERVQFTYKRNAASYLIFPCILTTQMDDSENNSPAEFRGLTEAYNILDAIDPNKCILCTGKKSISGVNTICTSCSHHLKRDQQLRFLHERTLELYNFWIALLRKTLSNEFYAELCAPLIGGHSICFRSGLPGVQTKVWMPSDDTLRWQDDRGMGARRWRYLTPHAKELLGQIQLTSEQCHVALLMLCDLMSSQLLDSRKSTQTSLAIAINY